MTGLKKKVINPIFKKDFYLNCKINKHEVFIF